MFYTIWGIIAMITAIVQIALATRYGKDGFELIMHFQTLLMLSFSSDNISSVRLDYLSWLQAFKFDFGFINPMINQNTQCSISSGRLFNLKLYWEDTLHNYFIIFCFLLILCGAKIIFFILQKYRDRVNFSQKQLVINILWIFVIIVNPFLIINISIDIMTIFNHTISSLFTFAYIMLLAIICFRNKLYFLQYDFIVKLDPQSSPYYIYMQILIKIECILLFLSYSKLVSSLIMITLLMTHTTMLFIQIQHRSVLPLQRNFDRTTTLFWNSVMLIIMMLVSVEKVANYYTFISYWIDLKMIYCWSSLSPSTTLLRPTTEPSLSRTSRSNWAKLTKRLALGLKCKLIWLDLHLRRSRKTDPCCIQTSLKMTFIALVIGRTPFPGCSID